MKCCVIGCDRDAMYTGKQLCQMHYFRVMRGGTTEKRVTRKQRRQNPAGYHLIYAPMHPLAQSGGYVYEHRKVLFDCLGWDLRECAICQKQITWDSCHVDHIDCNVSNNDAANLRPTCSVCNTRRSVKPATEWARAVVLEFEGERKTAADWARDPRVSISCHTIASRKRRGMPDEQALFSPKMTHKGK